MKQLILTFLLIYFCFNSIGCTYSIEKSFIQQEKKQQRQQDLFDNFLRAFVDAYKSNDTVNLVMLCNSPIEILGRQDSDPSLSIYGSDIICILKDVITNGGYYNMRNDNLIENIKLLEGEYKELFTCNLCSKECRINDFVFIETNEGWKLAQLFLDTRKFLEQKLNK